MAGGTFYSQNKVRPGAYINFVKSGTEVDLNSSRGIVAVGLPLSWGNNGEIINLSSDEMATGKSLAKVGVMTDDGSDTSKILNAILTNANIAKIYRLDSGGLKAKVVIDDLTVEAKYAGTFGNKIAILIEKDGDIYEVRTFADGYEVDTQRVTAITDIENNDFVTFTFADTEGEPNVSVSSSSKLLADGTDGTVTATTAYNAFFEVLKNIKWQVIAICNNDETVNPLIPDFIKKMRDGEGKYVQAVVANYDEADYEGIINNVNGAVINGVEFSAVEFTAYVAGMTASATATESNTGKIIEGATEIIDPLDSDEIETGLKTGQFILSSNQDGSIKVEQDINSLHNYGDLSYAFTKNRVMRVLDEIGSSIESIWENTFLGRVSNNEDGRDLFKSSITTYLTSLQDAGAIQNFGGSSDVSVALGEKIDAVVATIKVQPIDSMEFLYLTVNVSE